MENKSATGIRYYFLYWEERRHWVTHDGMKYRNHGEITQLYPFAFILADTNRSWALRYFYHAPAHSGKLFFLTCFLRNFLIFM